MGEWIILTPIFLFIAMGAITPLLFIFQLVGIIFKSLKSQYILASIYLIVGILSSVVMLVIAPGIAMAGFMAAGSYLTWMSFALIATPFFILAGGVAFLVVALFKRRRQSVAAQS